MKQRAGPAISATASRARSQRRAAVYRSLDTLHALRSRIDHHKPIRKRDLSADRLTLSRVRSRIDPDVRAWDVSLSRLQPLITARPH